MKCTLNNWRREGRRRRGKQRTILKVLTLFMYQLQFAPRRRGPFGFFMSRETDDLVESIGNYQSTKPLVYVEFFVRFFADATVNVKQALCFSVDIFLPLNFLKNLLYRVFGKTLPLVLSFQWRFIFVYCLINIFLKTYRKKLWLSTEQLYLRITLISFVNKFLNVMNVRM